VSALAGTIALIGRSIALFTTDNNAGREALKHLAKEDVAGVGVVERGGSPAARRTSSRTT
jgi:hypothetical protein